MLRFEHGSPSRSGRGGVLPAAFDPLTTAHVALTEAASDQYQLDQVVLLLPEKFPHQKGFQNSTFEQRLAMLKSVAAERKDLAVAVSDRGLFIEIARAFREIFGDVEIFLLCGRDAAERIVGWDYGEGPSFGEQLQEFQMLVAPRGGPYVPPEQFRDRIHTISLPPEFEDISSSAVREAIQQGRPWRHMVPPPVAELMEREGLYRPSRNGGKKE